MGQYRKRFPSQVYYVFQQRSNGRGAVVRRGPLGGSRTVATYENQDVAKEVVATLNQYARLESKGLS